MLEELAVISIIIVLNVILGILLTVFPFWNICKRAGLHPALSILSLIPVANIVFLFYLAFAKWPALEKENVPEPGEAQLNQKKAGNKILVAVGALLLILAPVIVITGTAYTLTLPKMYASQARIQINQDPVDMDPFNQTGNRFGGSMYDPYFLRTQYEIIQSKPILYEVINRLNLQETWKKQGENISKERAYKILRSSVSVNRFHDTNLIAITARRSNPREAMKIANTLADVYRDARLDLKHKEMTRALDALRQELEKQQEKVEAAEEKVETLRTELNIPSYTGGVDSSSVEKMRLQQLEGDRISARVEMLTQKARLEQLEAMGDEDLLTASAYLASDPFIESMRTQITDLDVELGSLRENYGENHPEVKQTKAARDELMTKLAQAMEGIKKGINAQHTIAKSRFDALEQELRTTRNTDTAAQRQKRLPFTRATQELEIQRAIMNALKARLAQEGITLKIPRAPVEMVDAAEESFRPVSPNLRLNILLSLGIAGPFALVGLILLIIGLKRT